jgi:hypothetical protein
MIRHMHHLHANYAAADSPLFLYYKQGQEHGVTNHLITKHLCLTGLAVNQPSDCTVEVLHNTGAQPLLRANVPLTLIKLLGHWCSDEVFC